MKGVMAKVGLIKKLEQVTDHKKINLSDSYYENILKWRALYRGHFAKWHDVHYQTIDGPQQRRMASLNMPKVASEELATLIFNERCEINISDKTFSDNLLEVFKDNNFNSNFQTYLEYMFALGGMVVKPYFKDGKIKLSYVTADCFLPISWDNVRVTEGVFINEFTKQNKRYVHLEWHTWENGQYIIKNEVFECSSGIDLGSKVSLKEHFPGLEEVVPINNLKLPMFTYFKPNIANNIDTTIPLGVPIYNNAMDTMKSIDIAFDSFQREFRLGRKRIIVPATAIKHVIDPQTGETHRYFDATDETYEAINGEMDDTKLHEITSTLRVTEHVAAINALLNLFAMQIGFSAGAFSFDGQSMKTATEVVSEQSKTFRTKQSHENVIEQGIADLIKIIGQTAEFYSLFSHPTEYDVTVQFDDSIAEDATAEINKQVLLITNGLQSKVKALMKIHGITEEEAEQLLKEIKEESQIGDEDVMDFFAKNKDKSKGDG